MQNPVTTLKQSVHKNPKPYLIASAVAGVAVGVVVTRKLSSPVALDLDFPLNSWIEEMNGLGLDVYVLPKEVNEGVRALVSEFNKTQ